MSDLNSLIAGVIRLRPEDITDETTMQDVESWDSLAHMELISVIENNYQIELAAEEIVSMTRVGTIREILAAKGLV